jgi:hypothetical protein
VLLSQFSGAPYSVVNVMPATSRQLLQAYASHLWAQTQLEETQHSTGLMEEDSADFPSYHISQMKNVNVLHLLVCSQCADLENSLNLCDSMIDTFTEVHGVINKRSWVAGNHFSLVYNSFISYSLTLLIISSNLRSYLVKCIYSNAKVFKSSVCLGSWLTFL